MFRNILFRKVSDCIAPICFETYFSERFRNIFPQSDSKCILPIPGPQSPLLPTPPHRPNSRPLFPPAPPPPPSLTLRSRTLLKTSSPHSSPPTPTLHPPPNPPNPSPLSPQAPQPTICNGRWLDLPLDFWVACLNAIPSTWGIYFCMHPQMDKFKANHWPNPPTCPFDHTLTDRGTPSRTRR